MRPGSAARMGTANPGRLGTGMQASYGLQQSINNNIPTTISASERPMTQHGLSGVRVTTAGPGRQIQDTSFFVGVLRTKIGDIINEINRMKMDMDKGQKDAQITATMERKYDTLLKEVRKLEGDLADYNLAMDKSRTAIDAGDINQVYYAVKRRNEEFSRELDRVFLERQEREKGAVRLEEAIHDLNRSAESRINSLPPALIAEYRTLTAENHAMTNEANNAQNELENINNQIEHMEMQLKQDRIRDEYALLEKRLNYLRKERNGLEEELANSRLDPAEAREKLLAKVKEDNIRVQNLDKQIKATEEIIQQRKKAIAEVTTEIEERRGEAGDSAKYEMLFKRDQEMTEFIDRYPEMREREISEQRRIQNTITSLLEYISESIERERSMPSRETAEEMKDDLDDKRRELKASEMTADRLQEELTLRQTELEKINTLDSKINTEITTLQERMNNMRNDMVKFADIQGLRIAAEEAKQLLQTKIYDYQQKRENLRMQLASASAAYEDRRSQLAKNSQATAIDALETKLKNYEQTVFSLRECKYNRILRSKVTSIIFSPRFSTFYFSILYFRFSYLYLL